MVLRIKSDSFHSLVVNFPGDQIFMDFFGFLTYIIYDNFMCMVFKV